MGVRPPAATARPPASTAPGEPFIPKSLGHYAEWIQACTTGAPTTGGFEHSGWLTESNHLGNAAVRAGNKLEWSPAEAKANGCPKADASIRSAYRSGWKLARSPVAVRTTAAR